MMKLRSLKVRRHTDRRIEFNKYLDVLPRENISDNILMTELNGFLKDYSQQLEQAGICAGIWLWIHYF